MSSAVVRGLPSSIEGMPLFDEGVDFETAQAVLDEQGLGDGLPLVPPTARRLAAMLEGVRGPDALHGQMAPLFGELTTAAVAYQCVLAGCAPGALPVVVTAANACLADEFNLLGIQTTTGTPTVAVLVHGPVARILGMSAGITCLGPGNRANATIGRAMSLTLRNIGGAREGVGDMATMGQPGKYTFAFAEGESPLAQPLHVRRGFAPGQSAVTVLGVSGTAEVLPEDGGQSTEGILRPIAVAFASSLIVSGAARKPERNEQVILLPPEMAGLIAERNWSLARVQEFLFADRSLGPVAVGEVGEPTRSLTAYPLAPSPADIHPIITGGPGVKMTHLPLWGGGTRTVTRKLIEL